LPLGQGVEPPSPYVVELDHSSGGIDPIRGLRERVTVNVAHEAPGAAVAVQLPVGALGQDFFGGGAPDESKRGQDERVEQMDA